MEAWHPGREPIATELYDHDKDADENVNVAGRPENAELVRKLTARIKTEGKIGGKRWASRR